jgi:hypothetical protein
MNTFVIGQAITATCEIGDKHKGVVVGIVEYEPNSYYVRLENWPSVEIWEADWLESRI